MKQPTYEDRRLRRRKYVGLAGYELDLRAQWAESVANKTRLLCPRHRGMMSVVKVRNQNTLILACGCTRAARVFSGAGNDGIVVKRDVTKSYR